MPIQIDIPEGFITKKQLCRRPGWALNFVDAALGEPDQRFAWIGRAPLALYSLARIETIEASDWFKNNRLCPVRSKKIRFYPGLEFTTQTEILERPGWTHTLVEQLLGEPDAVKPWRAGTLVKLYRLSRLEEAESRHCFKQAVLALQVVAGETEYLHQGAVIARPGWNQRRVRNLLWPPDHITKSARPVAMYARARVEEAERSPEFLEGKVRGERDTARRMAYRFQLRLTKAQEEHLQRESSMCVWLWNMALERQKDRHERGEPFANYYAMQGWLTEWRRSPETTWLAVGSTAVQQQVLRRLERAYLRFFARVKQGDKAPGFPKFKDKTQAPALQYFDRHDFPIDHANGRIQIPKIGWARFRKSREIKGQPKSLNVVREGAKWYCSIQVELSDYVLPSADVLPTLGIDLGIRNLATTSDGDRYPPPLPFKKAMPKLRRIQRRIRKRQKGSANRKKAVIKYGKLMRKVARQRRDWLHKHTAMLAKKHPVIAMEDLKVQSMTRSNEGTVEKPGKNRAAKRAVNRTILDCGWGEFRRQLGYKLAWNGGQLLVVPPKHTSQACRICGHRSADNRRSQSRFSCVACGHKEHADVHAAKNILAAGHAAWRNWLAAASRSANACGGDVRLVAERERPRRAAPVKQEPTDRQAEAAPARSPTGVDANQ